MVHSIRRILPKRMALASTIVLALAVAMASLLHAPAAMAAPSDATLSAAYMAYYDVLKAAVGEYGVGLNKDELRGGGYRGVFYAELIDFDNDGFPEMLIIYNEGDYEIEAFYSIYGYPGKLERYFNDVSYGIGDGRSWYGIGTARNNKEYLISSSEGEVGGGLNDHFYGNYSDYYYTVENGRWEEALKRSHTITRDPSDESHSWSVNDAQVSEQAYMMSIAEIGIINERFFGKPQELNTATVHDVLLKLNPAHNILDGASPWAYDGITAAFAKGFVPADMLGRYTDVITRAEFCRMAVRWAEYATGKNIDALLSEKGLTRDQGAFTDTRDPDIQAAFALGITNGTGVGIFSPDGQFSREQAATMVMNTCKAIGANVDGSPASGFNDISAASDWAVNGINFVRANGIMQGTSSEPPLFSPQAFYTREQSIITFNNIDHGALPGR